MLSQVRCSERHMISAPSVMAMSSDHGCQPMAYRLSCTAGTGSSMGPYSGTATSSVISRQVVGRGRLGNHDGCSVNRNNSSKVTMLGSPHNPRRWPAKVTPSAEPASSSITGSHSSIPCGLALA